MSEQHGEPTADEVLQDEPSDIPTVPVRIEGPVKAQVMPAVVWSRIARTLDSLDPIRILPYDPKRRRAILLAGAGNVHPAPSQAEAKAAIGVDKGWPANVPLTMEHNQEVWIVPDTVGQSVVIFIESWTE